VVTRALLWLLSADSANVNGVILPTDGGWSTV
jgi:NAD(P)-dependent dehydrogenase (short-subunit alcohol dehydrogenase family)